MSSSPIAAVLALALALASPLAADRIEFRAVNGGKRLTGAAVCFFPAEKDDPFFLKFLATNDVRCMDADAVIEIPAGHWNIFAVHPAGYVSAHPYYLTKGADGAVDHYAATDLAMDRSAILDLKNVAARLGPSEWMAIYLTNDSHPNSPANVRPVPEATTEIALPAEMTIVPIVVRSAQIVRFGDPMRLKPGERAVVPSFDSTAGVVTLVVAEDETTTADGAPEIALHAGKRRVEAMLRPPAYPQFSRALQFFRNVPAGEASIRLGGRGWISDEIAVRVRDGEVTQTPRALTTAPAATLAVAWSVTSTAGVEQLHAPANCDGPSSFDAGTVGLARCSGQDCKPVKEIPIDLGSGSGELQIDALRPGTYRVELTYASARARETIPVGHAQAARIALALDIGAITGTVTRAGAPISAQVSFPTGSGVSGTDGRYVAVVAGKPSTGTAYVHPCDGSPRYTHRGETPPLLDDDYDIDLPDNEIAIFVRDRATNEPLARARVVARLFAGDDELEALQVSPTGDSGRTTIEDVSSREPLEICASTPEHDVACAPRFLAGRGRRRVDLVLAPKSVRRGRVAGGSSRFSVLHWVSTDGTIKERTGVRRDGTFTFDHDPEPGETVVYLAADHPLTVVPAPPYSPGGVLRIDLPRTETRSFDVSLSGRSAAPGVELTIAVGSFVVPKQAFSEHQQMRAGDTRVQRGASIAVRDIASTAPLSIVYAETLSLPPNVMLTLPRVAVSAPRVEIP